MKAPWENDPVAPWDNDPVAEPTKPTQGGFAPREARERESTRDERKAAYREMARGVRERQSTVGRYVDTAGRGLARALPFMDEISAGMNYLTGRGGDSYEDSLDRERAMSGVDDTDRMFTSIGGQMVGSLALPGAAWASRGNALQRVGKGMVLGGGYGALYGAGSGDTLGERAEGALSGLKWGAGLGAGAGAAVEGVRAGAGALSMLVNPIIGYGKPREEALRRVGAGLGQDRAVGVGRMLDDAAYDLAERAGQEPMLIDRGGGTLRALARDARNSSPEAAQILDDALGGRAASQNEAAGDFLGRLFSPLRSPNPEATIERLKRRAQAANSANYARAEQAAENLVSPRGQINPAFPDGLMTPVLDRLAQSPRVQDAMKRSVSTGANEAAMRGYRNMPPRNPFVETAQGYVLRPAGPNGDRVLPTLSFWDQVQRNLRSIYQEAQRSGNDTLARQASVLRQQLNSHLDEIIPEFGQARAGAARAFGAEDAMEAGQNFFAMTKRQDLAEARKALAKMSPPERALFAEGYLAAAEHAARNAGDGRTASRLRLWNSPAEREKLQIAVGPRRAAEAEAYRARAQIMEWMNSAVRGNSTTAQQLAAAGLAGGAAGSLLSGDLQGGLYGASALALARYGAKGVKGAVDQKVAGEVARILSSNDPAVYAEVLRRSQRPQAIAEALNRIEAHVAKSMGVVGDEASDRQREPNEITVTPRGYAEGGMVTEPKDGEQYYGPGEDDRALLESLSPGGQRYVAGPATEYPGDALQDRYKDKLPLGVMVPRNAVEIIDTDIGAFPVDAEGRRLDWVRRPGMIPVAKDETGYYPAMPGLPEIASNIAGGGTEGAGMMVASGFRLPGKGRAAKGATEAAGAAPDVARTELPPPVASPLEEAAARAEPPPRAVEEPALPVMRQDEPVPPVAAAEEPLAALPAAPERPAAAGVADSGSEFHMELERGEKAAGRVRMSAEEKAVVAQLAADAKVDPAEALKMWQEKRAEYPTSDWAPMEPAKIVKNKDGTFEFEAREIPYAFNRKPGEARAPAEPDPKLAGRMARKLADEVFEVAARADQGDRNAQVIMRARNWYKAMRDRLRAEFGSFADVFADVLGTTSAQTNVRQNWDNAVEALSNFTSGAYDDTLTKLDDWFRNGGVIGNAKIEDGNGFLANGWVNNHERIKKQAMPAAQEQAAAEGLTGKAADARAKEIAFEAAQEQFPLITKSDGKTLFNANSPATMEAFLDLFRQVKAGDAPKTPNFTGNLIGYSSKATIDVWAARLLRRLAGMKPVPTIAEAGVGGAHMADVSKVGGEFGFGQEVFKQAADILRKDARFKDLGDDDLQAIVWFLEKENWTKKGWTNKAGEGGSLEYEANLAGIPDRQWVTEQRRLMNTDPTGKERKTLAADLKQTGVREAAEQKLQEVGWTIEPFPNGKTPTLVMVRNRLMQEQGIADRAQATAMAKAMQDEAKEAQRTLAGLTRKAERLDRLTSEYEATKAGAIRALDEAATPVQRFVGGLSPDRAEDRATDAMFATGSERLDRVLQNTPGVIAAKATPSKGRYIDPSGGVWDERSYDLEVVARRNFDPEPLWQQMVREAKRRNQDSVFLSEVVPPGTVEGANPGVEIYFRTKVDEATADAITKRINELGVDAGFTYAVDVRQANRTAQKKGEAPTDFVGIRVQYIPEFGGGIEGRQVAMERMVALVQEMGATPGVSNARYVEYDTQVAFGGDYDAHLAGSVSNGRQAAWRGQLRRQGAAGPDGGGGVPAGDVGGAPVHRWRGGPAARTRGEEAASSVSDDLHGYLLATSNLAPPPRRFAMGGPVFPAAVEPRMNALTRPRRGALSHAR